MKYLKNKHYQIIIQNLHSGGAEVDIVALKDDIMAFIEVKSRKSAAFGFPAEFVNVKKQQKIIRAAKIFSNKRNYKKFNLRFDVISILYQDGKVIINHIENAFEE